MEKTELTLFTANIWADVFGNPVTGRDAALAALIARYCPDVIMLQEAHPNWHRSETLKQALAAGGYAVSQPDLGSNTLNYTPLAYRQGRFRELKNVFRLYSGPNDYTSKSVSGALLEEVDTGRQFAAMSTHFYFAQNDEGNAARLSNARELAECFDLLCGAGPGFCGGDYNCDITSEPFGVLNAAGIRSASTLAEKKINFVRTHHKNPKYDAETGTYIPAQVSPKDNKYSIDHITVRGAGVDVTEYRVITDPEALILSDHCPMLIKVLY